MGAALELYGSLGVVAGFFQTAYLVAAFGLSGLLLTRGLRERELPPILLGLNLLLAMGLGYVLLSIGVVATELGDGTPPGWVAPLIAGGYATTTAGLIAALVFTYRVFRPGQPLALAFVSLASFGMCLGWVITGQSGGFTNPSFRGIGISLLLGSMLATNFWVASEPLAYYWRMRRRMRIGLAEPIVVERFLLWGAGSLARALMIILGPIAEYAIEYTDAAGGILLAQFVLVAASLLGLFTSVAYWLTFYPTEGYRSWVSRRFASVAAPVGEQDKRPDRHSA
ncbi:MAG: hypothetical protein GY937_28700 [bacterium]|nr:hypothetical protein [bacterium]